MSDRVYMSHPDLPGQRIHVRPSGMGVLQASGWQAAEPGDEADQQIEHAKRVLAAAGWTLTPPQAAAGEQPSEPDAATAASEPRRRRRAETEGE